MKNTEKEKPITDQVILQMEPQTTQKTRQSPQPSPQSEFNGYSIEREDNNNNSINSNSSYYNKPPNSPLHPRPALRRLSFSKPKSRFIETKYPPPSTRPIFESTEELNEPLRPQDNNNPSSESSEDEDIWNEEGEEGENGREQYRKKRRKLGWRRIVEWVSFFVIMTGLICSLTLKSLKGNTKWGLEIWKWCLMVMVIFCGRLVSGWVMGITVFFIEKNFILREKVLYFVYGLRKSIQNCVWLALVLLAWMFMFSSDVQRHNKIFKKVFRFLLGVLIGATIWLIKIILVKLLASSFHVATFFDRMKESVFHHYILDALSGPPLDELENQRLLSKRKLLTPSKSLPARLKDVGRKIGSRRIGGSRRIDMEKLRKLSMQSTASAWGVKRLVSYVMSSGLSTISSSVDQFGNSGSEITSEWEARAAAQKIFKNVAKPGAKFIEEGDLLRFLSRDEVHTIFPFFEGALETGHIRKSAFRNWVTVQSEASWAANRFSCSGLFTLSKFVQNRVTKNWPKTWQAYLALSMHMVQAYVERRALAHSLNDTKTAVQQLHKLASAIVLVIIAIVLLLVMGLATSKVIVVVSSQLLLVGFMFQNTCKTIFESIIFVFVMHPFDVGDRCVIDGTQMIVEEMNILTTVFLRYDNEKIYYPNSVLSTKPISNFYRSPDMADMVNFSIDVSTSVDNVTALKKAIQGYIEGKPKYWLPKHMVLVKEIENVDKMHMSLCVTHTMNHQNFAERSLRRSELVFELKKIFDSLGIKYNVLPQEVHLNRVQTASGGLPPMHL